MAEKSKTYILSVGGSLIVPDQVDVEFLKNFRSFVLEKVEQGCKFVIICGGGKVNTRYNEAAKAVVNPSYNDLDLLGISITRVNAELVRIIFGEKAYPKIITDPTKKVRTAKPVIIGAGYKPGWSTDYDAVLMARNQKAKTVINLSNIDYAYTDDPKKNPAAKPIENISWENFRKLVGDDWKPRMNTPFDPIATKLAQKSKLRVIILNGRNLENLRNCLEDKYFTGTVIE